MNRGMTRLAALAVVCTGTVLAQAAPEAEAQPKVYVYRYKAFQGKGLRPSIYVDDKDVVRLQSGRGVVLTLPAGPHRFRSNDKQSQIELDLKSGQVYYIRLEIASGFLKGHGRLTLVMPEQGAGEYKQLKPVDKEMIKDSSMLAPDFTPTP